jgi:AcrR family transcriptional regulator
MNAGRTARDRARAELTQEIKDVARRQLAADGAERLSLRAISRELGMVSSALYRYFPSRDDLITGLVIAGFENQATAVEAAAGREPDAAEALRAAMLAYRDWAKVNPAWFGLLYGAPVPGYVAPEATIGPGARLGDLLVGLATRLWDQGRIAPETLRDRASRLDAASAADLRRLAERRGYVLPVEALAIAVDGWVRVHGVTVMEVFGQLRPLIGDGRRYVAQCVDAAVAELIGG